MYGGGVEEEFVPGIVMRRGGCAEGVESGGG